MSGNCNECPLKNQPKVLGKGSREDKDKHYRVAFVGIAPAKEEVEQGAPFVGRSGQLLWSVVGQLEYGDSYATNIMLCELPGDFSSSDQRKAIECCKDRLFSELKEVNPEFVVALGVAPLGVLTGKDYSMRDVAGRLLPGPGFLVLPVTHPAAVLRRPEEFSDFVDALESGKRYMSGSYLQAVVPKAVIVNEDNIKEILQTIENAELIAVDLETTGKGFFPYGRHPDTIRCVVVSVDDETSYIFPGKSSPHFEPHPDFSEDEGLKRVINNSKCIFHNGQFDCGFLLQAGYSPKIFYDTFLAHYILDEREYSHGLKKLAHKYLGAPDWEKGLKEFLPNKKSSYDLIPDDKLYTYAASDTAYTYLLYKRLKDEVDYPFFSNLIIPCANMFNELRHRGLRIDVDVLMSLEEVLEKELRSSTEELEKLAGYYLNPFSPQEVAVLLYDKLEFPIVPRYGRSTSKKALAQYPGNPVVDKVIECRNIGKLRSTYIAGLASFVDLNFRIHPFTKLHGAVTGRLATEDPSVMNVTEKGGIKKLYIPEDGHLIVDADFKAMELRCYAVIAEDIYLKELLELSLTDPTKDPHTMVAVEASKRCGREITRQQAKSGVFGKLYGRGVQSFVYGYGLSEKDAVALMKAIESLFPTIKKYNEGIRVDIHKYGELESYFGRKRRFGLLTRENTKEAYRMGANFKVQSMASDINLYTMLHMFKEREKFRAVPLFPVHDSIVFDVESQDCIAPIKKEIEEYARSLVDNKIGFRVEIKAGKSWGDTEKWKEGS